MPDEPTVRGTGVWSFPRELGSDSAFALVGSVPVAVLAGFALATAVQVASRGHSTLDQIAVAALGIGVACFLLTLDLVFAATQYLASPDTRLSFQPEARLDADALHRVRERQWADAAVLAHYADRVNRWYTFALISTLLGFGAAVLAPDVNAGTVVAAVATGLLILLEAVNARRNRPLLPRRLFKGPKDVEEVVNMPDLDALSAASVAASDGADDWLLDAGMRTARELEAAAEGNGTGALYRDCVQLLLQRCDGWHTTGGSLVATAVSRGGHCRVVALHPMVRRQDRRLCTSVVVSDTADWLGISEVQLVERVSPHTASGPVTLGARGYLVAIGDAGDLDRIIAPADPSA